MQSVRSRIWTRVDVSISCDDNHYTTGTYNGWYAIKPNKTKSLIVQIVSNYIFLYMYTSGEV